MQSVCPWGSYVEVIETKGNSLGIHGGKLHLHPHLPMLISSNLLVFIRYRVQVKGCPRVGDMQKEGDVVHAPKLLIF